MMKIAGSRSTLQRHGSADPDPDPHQNVMDPQHWFKVVSVENDSKPSPIRALFLKMVTSTDYKIAGLCSILDTIYTMIFVQGISLEIEHWLWNQVPLWQHFSKWPPSQTTKLQDCPILDKM